MLWLTLGGTAEFAAFGVVRWGSLRVVVWWRSSWIVVWWRPFGIVVVGVVVERVWVVLVVLVTRWWRRNRAPKHCWDVCVSHDYSGMYVARCVHEVRGRVVVTLDHWDSGICAVVFACLLTEGPKGVVTESLFLLLDWAYATLLATLSAARWFRLGFPVTLGCRVFG